MATVNPDDFIDILIGSFQAVPTEGRRPLLVHFSGDPLYDVIVEDETSEYLIVETEDSSAVIVEFEHGVK